MLRAPLLTCILILGCVPAEAVRFSGYVKSYAMAVDSLSTPYYSTDHLYVSNNSIRLMWNQVNDHSAWQLHYDVSPVFASNASALQGANYGSGNAWRLTDITPTLSNNPKHRVLENLDRLNVQFNFKAGDLTIGRQPITFGMARIINPTDVFLPYDVRTLNTEYRVGIDAIRFQHPFGQLSELDSGVILGKDGRIDDSAAYLQMRTNVAGNDLQMALIRFAGQSLFGAGVQSSVGAFGVWLEAADVRGDVDYWRVSTGLDYAFSENVYGLVEYHFNGAGSDDFFTAIAQQSTAPYRVGGVFLLGKQYLIPALTIQLSPLWGLSLKSLINLSDHSTFAAVSADWNVSENIYIDFGYYHFMGSSLSEYGSNPDSLYASLKFYF